MKGIVKHKRSRKVWDEITKDWVPRFGRGSIKKIEEDANWIRVAPADGCMNLTELYIVLYFLPRKNNTFIKKN